MKESGYTKVYEVISDEYHLSMKASQSGNRNIVDDLCNGDTIFWSIKNYDATTRIVIPKTVDSFMGVYNKGVWIDLSNSGECYFLVSGKGTLSRAFSPGKGTLPEKLSRAFSLYECIMGNIIKDVTISYRRDEKLNQIGI